MDNYDYYVYAPNKSAYQYLCTWGDINLFTGKLVDGTITGFDITGLFQDNNDYVVSITYFPIKISNFVTTQTGTQTIVLGKNDTPITGKTITKQTSYYNLGSFTITRRYNNYLDYAPYTQFTLYVPYFEKITIDPKLAYSSVTINVYMSVDLLTGKATLYVVGGDIIIETKTAQLGITIPLGKTNEQEQTRNNILQGIGLISSIGSLVYGGTSGNALALVGGLALATKTTTTMIQNNIDKLNGYTGMQGSRDGLCVDKTCRLIAEYPRIVSEPNVNLVGKPCMKNLSLTSVSGFTRVQVIHFDPKNAKIYQDEIQEIVSLLKEGVIL